MQGKMPRSSGDGACEEADLVKKNAKPCQAKRKERSVVLPEAVLTAEPVVVKAGSRTNNVEASIDVYLTIEDCTDALPPAVSKSGRTGASNGDSESGSGVRDESMNSSGSAPQAELEGECTVATERGLIVGASGSPDEPSLGDVADDEPIAITVATPSPRPAKWARPAAENEEVDDVVRATRNILMDLRNKENARLNPEDEAKVRSVLEYHPRAEEKMGSGVDYITIKRHAVFKDARCFWVVRTDGSETDFSYHKCLKEKVAKEHPTFVDRYDAIYRAGPKGPRRA